MSRHDVIEIAKKKSRNLYVLPLEISFETRNLRSILNEVMQTSRRFVLELFLRLIRYISMHIIMHEHILNALFWNWENSTIIKRTFQNVG